MTRMKSCENSHDKFSLSNVQLPLISLSCSLNEIVQKKFIENWS